MQAVQTPTNELARVRRVVRGNDGSRDDIVIDDLDNILEALKGGVKVERAFCTPSENESKLALMAAGVRVSTVSPEDARAIFGTERASRVFALAHSRRAWSMAALAADPRDIVVLDGVRLAGNIGAVVRTSAALGAAGLVVLNSGLDTIYDRRLIRSSRGLIFTTPVILSTPTALLSFCSEHGIPVFSTSTHSGHDVSRLPMLCERIALVFGGERGGCSPQLEEGSAAAVNIGTSTKVESLNVSVAAGIAIHARARRNLGHEL